MPIAIAAIPAVIGGIEAIAGGIKQRRARKDLLNQQTPTVAPSKAINDYYQSAMNRWAAGPYNSLSYQVNKRGAQQAEGAAINSAQSRKEGVQTAGAIQQMYTNNLYKAGAQAENQGNAAFNQYGKAAGAKYNDERYTFGINSMLPYNKTREVYAAQLGGGVMETSAGLQSINDAFNNIGTIGSANIKAGKNFWGK